MSFVRRYIHVHDVARIFGRSPKTVRRWIAEGATSLEVMPNSRPLMILAASVTTFQQTGFLTKIRDTIAHDDLDDQ